MHDECSFVVRLVRSVAARSASTIHDRGPTRYRQGCHCYDRRRAFRVVVVGATSDVRERAAVTYPAPHGTESFLLRDGDVVGFGRGVECPIRFGYAPIQDDVVPRLAGQLVVANQRVFVEGVDAPGRPAIEIAVADGPSVPVALGEAHSPRASRFSVHVRGTDQVWKLTVTVRAEEPPSRQAVGGPPTRTYELALTPMQRRVVAAYLEPMQRGRLEPATHREAAASLSYHPNSVREALYDVWSKMFAAGIPIPDISDKRIAVVEAIRIHGLLRPEDSDVVGPP
jgi:hypothetical protein